MLELVNLDAKLSKEDFAPYKEDLQRQMSLLQQKIRAAGIPVIILFEGWGASGKGSRIRDIISTWDPRWYKVSSLIEPSPAEMRFPLMRRYWQDIPQKGLISVFDRSWYMEVHSAILDHGGDLKTSQKIWRSRIADIQNFERQLAENGYVIIKFFLHISKKEQKKRFDDLLSSPTTAWRVTATDKKRHKMYKDYYEIYDSILEETNRLYAPWNVVSSTDRRFAVKEIYSFIIKQVTRAIEQKESGLVSDYSQFIPKNFKFKLPPPLDEVDLSQKLEDSDYDRALSKAQNKLAYLHNKIYHKKVPVIIVFEGWDGAGKGGAIKRLTRGLDARGCEVIPIAAPASWEKTRHHLWRFWNALPKTGHITIFDRSWYGRCMVERIEGFCSQSDWQRSYTEINEFEDYLRRQGFVLVKFWMHIDKDEQLRRFTERQSTAEKQWKITDEDWRNREKWDEYKTVVEEMFAKTSTDFAPWTIIAGNDKNFARIQVLEQVIKALQKAGINSAV